MKGVDMASHRSVNFLAAAGLGAALMYFLDPREGRRRVALVRDRCARLSRKGRDTADAGWRDLANRTNGLLARARGAWNATTPDDDVLVERVRAELGRRVSHPHAIEVSSVDCWVTLAGPILEHEMQPLLHAVHAVRGVRHVKNELVPHADAAHVPALQGGRRARARGESRQGHWAPGPRLAVLGAGSVLALAGARRGGATGALAALAGATLAARAVANQDLGRLLGLTADPHAVEIEKSIRIGVPREQVWALWSQCDQFPRFMSLVEEVRRLDDDRWHWMVKGLAGRRLEWDAAVTERRPPELLAWRSEPDAPVQHEGRVRFDETARGTRVTVRMCYRPPAGVIGHTVAALFGRDARHELDADLMRMKAYLETGRAPHDAAQHGKRASQPRPADQFEAAR
jgi:uncharacterized membrane protein